MVADAGRFGRVTSGGGEDLGGECLEGCRSITHGSQGLGKRNQKRRFAYIRRVSFAGQASPVPEKSRYNECPTRIFLLEPRNFLFKIHRYRYEAVFGLAGRFR